TVTPTVHSGGVLVTRHLRDWTGLSGTERAQVRYLLLQNGDDPIPKSEAPLLWRTRSGSARTRPGRMAPRGVPDGCR
ncbi:MAG TPA: hypothetical protein VES60_14710, partial [Nakamurella sp.]|nr:hypothetical protein [Nakamurella sp.]